MSVLNEFQEKFKINEYLIYETNYWIWSLRPHQATLGAGILSLKRECLMFSELNEDEFKNLNNIIKIIEPTLKKSFNYDVMNYFMLMMFDKHVHYHVLPRYEKPVKFLDDIWNDDNWPGIPSLVGDSQSNEELREITAFVKNNL